MGTRVPPESPSSGADATDDPGRTVSVCCWCDDYEKEISVEPHNRYYKCYKADGTQHTYTGPVKLHLDVPVKTGIEITVTLKFKVVRKSGVAAADETAAKATLKKGVSDHWDNAFTIACADPAAECGTKSFKVRFKVEWVASGEHFILNVHQTYAREGVTGTVMDVSKTTGSWTYAHEFGHAFGLPDEYSYTADTETVKYIKPDGTLSAAISAPPSKPSSDASATIMSTHSNTTIKARHGWCIAIETQELLRAKLGRDIVCTVSK